jgi:hypothetical protein
MALNKVNYIDGETVISAENLNDIQDEVIAHGDALGDVSEALDNIIEIQESLCGGDGL